MEELKEIVKLLSTISGDTKQVFMWWFMWKFVTQLLWWVCVMTALVGLYKTLSRVIGNTSIAESLAETAGISIAIDSPGNGRQRFREIFQAGLDARKRP